MKKVKIKLATETITTPDLPSTPIVAITGEAVELGQKTRKGSQIGCLFSTLAQVCVIQYKTFDKSGDMWYIVEKKRRKRYGFEVYCDWFELFFVWFQSC